MRSELAEPDLSSSAGPPLADLELRADVVDLFLAPPDKCDLVSTTSRRSLRSNAQLDC